MHHAHKRRLRPSLIFAALFVALGGTAIAQTAILINNSNQVAPGVINGRHIENESLSKFDLKDPQLRLRVSASGERIGSGDGTVSRAGQGVYDVTFSDTALNGATGQTTNTVLNENCAITATSRQSLAVMTVDGPTPQQPNTVRVKSTFPQNVSGGVLMTATDNAFDVTATC